MPNERRHWKVQFASDHVAGICPAAWDALAEANGGTDSFVPSYGDDEEFTQRAARRLREVFEADCEVFFVLSGTVANALARIVLELHGARRGTGDLVHAGFSYSIRRFVSWATASASFPRRRPCRPTRICTSSRCGASSGTSPSS